MPYGPADGGAGIVGVGAGSDGLAVGGGGTTGSVGLALAEAVACEGEPEVAGPGIAESATAAVPGTSSAIDTAATAKVAGRVIHPWYHGRGSPVARFGSRGTIGAVPDQRRNSVRLDEAEAIVALLRERRIVAHVHPTGLTSAAVRVVLRGGAEAIWDGDRAAGLEAMVLADGMLVGYVPLIRGSEDFDEVTAAEAIAHADYRLAGS